MINSIAAHIARQYPSQVDSTINGNGQPEAGYVGHEPSDEHGRVSDWAIVGWFTAGGNAGDPVFSIHPDDLGTLEARLAALPDGELERREAADRFLTIRKHREFQDLRIKWHV